jgi:hypothetical protein
LTASAILGPPASTKREVQAFADYVEIALPLIDRTRAAEGAPAILARI